MYENHDDYEYDQDAPTGNRAAPVYTKWSGFAPPSEHSFDNSGYDEADITQTARLLQIRELKMGAFIDELMQEGLATLKMDYRSQSQRDSYNLANPTHFVSKGVTIQESAEAVLDDHRAFEILPIDGRRGDVLWDHMNKIHRVEGAPTGATDVFVPETRPGITATITSEYKGKRSELQAFVPTIEEQNTVIHPNQKTAQRAIEPRKEVPKKETSKKNVPKKDVPKKEDPKKSTEVSKKQETSTGSGYARGTGANQVPVANMGGSKPQPPKPAVSGQNRPEKKAPPPAQKKSTANTSKNNSNDDDDTEDQDPLPPPTRKSKPTVTRSEVKESPKTCSFYRILPPSKALKTTGNAASVDPISTQEWIDGFKLQVGDIVYDLNKDYVRVNGLSATHVRTATGEEGLVWLRRLQVVDGAFGLKDSLNRTQPPAKFETYLESKPVQDLRNIAQKKGISTDNMKKAQLKSALRESYDHTTRLRVVKLSEDHTYKQPGPVDLFFEKGETVLEDVFQQNVPDGYCGLRDMDGRIAFVKKTGEGIDYDQPLAVQGWKLRVFLESGMFSFTKNLLQAIHE